MGTGVGLKTEYFKGIFKAHHADGTVVAGDNDMMDIVGYHQFNGAGDLVVHGHGRMIRYSGF